MTPWAYVSRLSVKSQICSTNEGEGEPLSSGGHASEAIEISQLIQSAHTHTYRHTPLSCWLGRIPFFSPLSVPRAQVAEQVTDSQVSGPA